MFEDNSWYQTACGMFSSFFALAVNLKLRNPNFEIQLPRIKWYKLGMVSEIYRYPLMFAKGQLVSKCEITPRGVIQINENNSIIWDRMFIVYSLKPHEVPQYPYLARPNIGQLITTIHFPRLNGIKVSIDEDIMIFEAPGMPEFVFDTAYFRMPLFPDCKVSCCDDKVLPIECVDFGDDAAAWISELLTGFKNSKYNLRVAFCGNKSNVMDHLRTCCNRYYQDMYTDDIQAFIHMDRVDNMMIATQSMNDFHMNFAYLLNNNSFHPSIFIWTQHDLRNVDEWEWMKIGDVILKNKIPIESTPDDDSATSLDENFPRHVLPGINSDILYPGDVKLGDEVFVAYTNNREE